jgi:hypothetical protein
LAALRSLVLLAVAVAASLWASAAQGAVLRVPEDRPSVATALASAANGDTVLLAPGTYLESVTLPSGVTLRSADPAQPAVLDAGGSARVLTISQGSAFSRLEGITLRNGQAGGGPGGGVRVVGGSLSLSDVRIEACQAAFGGALSLENGAHLMWDGGAVTGCSASFGGALFADGGRLALSHLTISSNSAQTGGALYAQGASPVSLVSCSLHDNQASGSGGALAFQLCGASLSDCRLDHNVATGNGGALWSGPGSGVVCSYSVFSNHQAAAGGAVYATCDGPAGAGCSLVQLAHVDLIRNQAPGSGAGAADGASRIEAQACVVAFNDGGLACLDSRATVDIGCSLLHGNGPAGGSGCAGSVSDTTSADPLLCDLGGGGFERCSGSPALAPATCGAPFLGALGQGCPSCATTPTQTMTWGGLKARYR